MKLTQKHLKTILHYDPVNGHFTWLDHPSKRHKHWIGKRAGSSLGRYRYINLYNKRFKEVELAYLYMTGKFPSGIVDHKNRCGLDNSWDNLRVLSHADNLVNRKLPKRRYLNMPVGVYPETWGRYRASCRVDGKTKHIGTYDTPELSHDAYVSYVRSIR